MNLEELLKLLQESLADGVDFEDISKAVSKVIADTVKTQTSGLTNENKDFKLRLEEVGVELNELKERYKNFESDEITYDGYLQLKEDRDKLKESIQNADPEGRYQQGVDYGKKIQKDSLEPEIKKLTQKISDYENRNADLKEKYINFKKIEALNKAIDQMGIKPSKLALAGLQSQMQTEYVEDEDRFIHKMFHDGNYVPLEDFVSQFPNTEDGKSMTPAPVNTGGGAKGGREGGKKYTLNDLRDLDPADPRAPEIMESLGFKF